MSSAPNNVRTWVEVNRKALLQNTKEFLRLLSPKTRLMAVVKSNAYGHGLVPVVKTLDAMPHFRKRGWLGVDSIVEGLRLRREGIVGPILVLGATLPSRIEEAAENDIILTVSSFDALKALHRVTQKPQFHIKIDTGMHRQGFLPHDVPKLIRLLRQFKLPPHGVYTHFAAKDWGYPTYTNVQLAQFTRMLKNFQQAGFRNLLRHAAASDATLLFPDTHLDLVRVGMGLYGYWPSSVAAVKHPKGMTLTPVLAWKTYVSEVKEIPAGAHVGYDISERVTRKTKTAVLPIGYWHGLDRGFSSIGEVLVRGQRAKILGRVSMDMTVVDVTSIRQVSTGDEVVLIGKQGHEEITADHMALKINTTHYETLTRINPLIKRILV